MKYVLITGATGGLGGLGAKELANRGWYVFGAGTNEQKLNELKNIPNMHPIKMDITDQESVEAAYREVCEVTDHLDALVNFSGVQIMSSLIEGDASDIVEKVLSVNVMGMVRVNQTFFPLVEKTGRIVNCSSECGWLTPQPFNGPYTLSKYAVEAYNNALRRELSLLDVPVVKIQPGSFKTAMHNNTLKSFDAMLSATTHYNTVLKTMRSVVEYELKMANDPKHLVKALVKAVESPLPKINYRVKNSAMLQMLEGIPSVVLDKAYKAVLNSPAVNKMVKKLGANA